MPWLKWLPWRFVVRRIASAHGFLDPVALLARLHRFAEPAEVAVPVELLRAGVVFHARGLINARVIQHNLDWVWPYWIERQFDPSDDAFVPRAFSITHVNLTHRNWTAIGLPDLDALPIVDPRGLLTPHHDGWSLDAWVIGDDGSRLLPSRTANAIQRAELDKRWAVTTKTAESGLVLRSDASVRLESGAPVCELQLRAASQEGGWLVVALRPYNPEGISFIHEVELCPQRIAWDIDGHRAVTFSAPPAQHHVSDYREGDVAIHLEDRDEGTARVCEVGMASAAALFRLAPECERDLVVRIPLASSTRTERDPGTWQEALHGCCQLQVPDERMQFLYAAALRTLVLHSPNDVYPGPYTYKRFWFRDAAFIIHAMLCTGLTDRAERALDRFPAKQTASGYFHSQEGEWDANGETLWIMHRYCALTNCEPKRGWRRAILRGARWIGRKRLSKERHSPHAGLLPAGFSAEHLGPSDYYYWDSFWGVAGLRAAAALCVSLDQEAAAQDFLGEAEAFRVDIDRSLAGAANGLGRPAMPASPYRRLDAGAIGSLVVGYPLQLCSADDPRLLDTAAFLLDNCFVAGGFFQDMIHAGVNPYLTLHIAQVLLRAGDGRYMELLDTVTELASPTGQWPEAIHPRTGGGCMGDGQHVWAAAEWVLMLRHLFLREEEGLLVLCQGVPSRWLAEGDTLRFGPAPTAFGTVTLEVLPVGKHIKITWEAEWHSESPPIEVRLPGLSPVRVPLGAASIELPREGA